MIEFAEAVQAFEKQTCRRCWEDRPVTHFRWKNKAKGKRHDWCRACATADEKTRRTRNRHKRGDRFAQRINDGVRCGTNLKVIVGQMVRSVGGVENFTGIWKDSWEAARKAGKRSLVFRHWKALIEIMKIVDQDRPQPSEMSDEDLEIDMWRMIVERLDREPGLVRWAAERHGFRLVPLEEAHEREEEGGGV
ncbi:MAG: hypothetical protein RIC55_35880, partial [Pirellulaceae bacterium]